MYHSIYCLVYELFIRHLESIYKSRVVISNAENKVGGFEVFKLCNTAGYTMSPPDILF